MKVRFLGFELKLKGATTLDELVDFVENENAVRIAKYERVLRMTLQDEHLLGVVLTLKEERQSLELETEEFVVNVREVEKGKAPVALNFFVVNTTTMRGLYSHYQHSMGLKRLQPLLSNQMKRLVDTKAQKMIAAAEAKHGHLSDRRKTAIRAEVQTHVSVTQMVRHEDLPDLIQAMHRFKRIRFELATLAAEAPTFGPVRDFVKTVRAEVVFDQSKGLEKAKNAVAKFAASMSGRRGTIIGEDDDGEERILSLLENYERFGEIEFGDAAKAMSVKLDEFAKSPMLKRLQKAIEENSEYFEG